MNNRTAHGVCLVRSNTIPTAMFPLFDPAADLRITAGNLPHWFQPGVTYFVTWRADDSMPQQAAELWLRRRNDWLRRRGIDPAAPGWQKRLDGLPEPQQNEFHADFSQEFLAYLDSGHGQCVLRRPELAAIIAENLRHFDGTRYVLADFVVMPNHVHVLVCLMAQTDLQQQCYGWKKYTATQINRALGRNGRFWHEESFDHLVRNPGQFEHLRRYIAENPRKAGLRPGEYMHWSRELQQPAQE